MTIYALILSRLIDWLVFSANFSSSSAISWRNTIKNWYYWRASQNEHFNWNQYTMNLQTI